MIFLQTLQQISAIAQHPGIPLAALSALQLLAGPPGTVPAPVAGTGDSLKDLGNFLETVRAAIFYVGLTVFLISITVAGVMRMTAFGNERRIATSNMALAAAVAGLIIMLAAQGLYNFIATSFKVAAPMNP